MRPRSVSLFSALYLASIALAVVNIALTTVLVSRGPIAPSGPAARIDPIVFAAVAAVISLILAAAIPLLLWFLAVRKRSRMAWWLLVVFGAISTVFLVWNLIVLFGPGATALPLAKAAAVAIILSEALALGALVFLLAPATRAWIGIGGPRQPG